jgi:hypothetical protein
MKIKRSIKEKQLLLELKTTDTVFLRQRLIENVINSVLTHGLGSYSQ